MEGAGVTVMLAEAGEQGPPSGPMKPALQVQLARASLPAGELEPAAMRLASDGVSLVSGVSTMARLARPYLVGS